jgi:hypothetical protein
LRGRDDEGSVNNVQYKSNQNCHYDSLLYNEYILIRNKEYLKEYLKKELSKITHKKRNLNTQKRLIST